MSTQLPFEPSPHAQCALTGDRTRIVRIAVTKWGKVPRVVRRLLRVTLETYTRRRTTLLPGGGATTEVVEHRRRLRWNDGGVAHVVDGGVAHAEVRAVLAEHKIAYTERVVSGTWRLYRDTVAMSVPATARRDVEVAEVGMPVMARRGSRWCRWKGSPALWEFDRALLGHLAGCEP